MWIKVIVMTHKALYSVELSNLRKHLSLMVSTQMVHSNGLKRPRSLQSTHGIYQEAGGLFSLSWHLLSGMFSRYPCGSWPISVPECLKGLLFSQPWGPWQIVGGCLDRLLDGYRCLGLLGFADSLGSFLNVFLIYFINIVLYIYSIWFHCTLPRVSLELGVA